MLSSGFPSPMWRRTVAEAGLTLAGALSVGSATGVACWAFIEAVDHRGQLGAEVAIAATQFVVPIVFLAVPFGGFAVWYLSRRFYRGGSRTLRGAALLGAAALLAMNTLGIVFALFASVVCSSTGTGCVSPAGPMLVMSIGVAGALALGGWWLSIPRRSFYVG